MSTADDVAAELLIDNPRKLAEVWALPGRSGKWDVQLRVIVGDWTDEMAEYAAGEAVKEIARAGVAGELEYARDDRLSPPGSKQTFRDVVLRLVADLRGDVDADTLDRDITAVERWAHALTF